MPTFDTGVTKTAKITIKNPTAKELSYTVEVYLSATKAASGSGSAVIGPGAQVVIPVSLIMPGSEGTWPVFVDVYAGSQLLAHFQGSEGVVTYIQPAVVIVNVGWE